jgi:hypothetical protein
MREHFWAILGMAWGIGLTVAIFKYIVPIVSPETLPTTPVDYDTRTMAQKAACGFCQAVQLVDDCSIVRDDFDNALFEALDSKDNYLYDHLVEVKTVVWKNLDCGKDKAQVVEKN